MSKSAANSAIRLRGVRHNNLKNFDLDLPLGQLIVITGLSGSGKSSLAFDTLYAEGQRRYIETFSPYARQFFDRMDKPQVDSIEGIPPAIAIEQRNTVRTTRSTVGTMTEICDYLKLLWPEIARLHCRQCGQPVRKEPPHIVWETLEAERATRSAEHLITFDLPLSTKLPLAEMLVLIAKQGYQRLLLAGRIVRLDDAPTHIQHPRSSVQHLTVVQDRLRLTPANRARFVEACEQAYHFGKGKLAIHRFDSSESTFDIRYSSFFSNRLHCAACDLEYREPSPALFSFNHPLGACPACKGFGRIITIDYHLAIPNRSQTLAEGVVKPWRSGFSAECQDDLMKFCKARRVPVNVSFAQLSPEHQRWVIAGDADYGKDPAHEWPHAWYGVKGYFRWLESKAYKMHVRVLLSRYRAYTKCPDCNGARLKPEALLYRLMVGTSRTAHAVRGQYVQSFSQASVANRKSQLTLSDFYAMPVRDALDVIEDLGNQFKAKANDHLALVLDEVRSRLGYLKEIGLGYITLDRPTRTLSGGETERVNLTTSLGTRLVNTLFVLDEPSVGLHPRDTNRLISILEQLRDAGNTVVVVEHEASVIHAADQIVDLGPGQGATGGQVVFQGTFAQVLKSRPSLTGQYLSGRRRIEIPQSRPVIANVSRLASNAECHMPKAGRDQRLRASTATTGWLTIHNASCHNLRNLNVGIPLNRFVCVTGVSGSGKTTLVREVLLPALAADLKPQSFNLKSGPPKASERIEEEEDGAAGSNKTQPTTRLTGHEHLSRVVLVDQAILGKTPRSNPAVYIGAFDDIRECFAQTEAARQRGLNASAFSFNSSQGQCERCRGAGFEKIEMQFLSDVFIRCPDCNGRRYRGHILEVKVRSNRGEEAQSETRSPKSEVHNNKSPATPAAASWEWSIADLLDATVDEVVEFLTSFASSKPAKRASAGLKMLQEVGLGYLRVGQPINTLSGGESQRLKLVRHLAEFAESGRADSQPTLFLFDEPTTGLHFDDVRVLLQVFQRLVDAGHSLVVIEHNLDVIKCADWIIDLGPEAGDDGGQVVAAGKPEEVAACPVSHTGRFLRDVMKSSRSHTFSKPAAKLNRV